jgi:hypothetical protein
MAVTPTQNNFLWADRDNGLFTCTTIEVVRKPTGCQDPFLNMIPVFPEAQAVDAQVAHYYPVGPTAKFNAGADYIPTPKAADVCDWPDPCGDFGVEVFLEDVRPPKPFECATRNFSVKELLRKYVLDGILKLSSGDDAQKIAMINRTGVLPPDLLLRETYSVLELIAEQMSGTARWGDGSPGRFTGLYRRLRTAPTGEYRVYDSAGNTVTPTLNQQMPSLAAEVEDWGTIANQTVASDCTPDCAPIYETLCPPNDNIDILDVLYRKYMAFSPSSRRSA